MDINGQEGSQNSENKYNNRSMSSFPPLVLKFGSHLTTLIFLGLAVHLILPQIASFEESFQVIRTMALWAVLLAGLAEIISYFGYSYLINSVLSITNQHISILKGVAISLAASSRGILAGGTVGNAAAAYQWVKKTGVSKESSGLAGTLPTMFNNAVLIILAMAGTVHLLLVHELSSMQSYAFILTLTLLGLGALAVSWGRRHRARFKARVGKIAASFSRIRKKPYKPDPVDNFVDRLFSSLDVLHKGGWQRPALAASFSIGLDMLNSLLLLHSCRKSGKTFSPSCRIRISLPFRKNDFSDPGWSRDCREHNGSPVHRSWGARTDCCRGHTQLQVVFFLDSYFSRLSNSVLFAEGMKLKPNISKI